MATRSLIVVSLVVLVIVSAGAGAPAAMADQPPAGPELAPSSLLLDISTIVDSATVTPGNFDAVRVLCPAGTVAIGGGIDLENVLTMVVTSSGPTFAGADARLIFRPNGPNPAPNGWQASARNNDTVNKSMKVAAICAHVVGVSTVVESGTASPGNFDAVRAQCPRGTVATGGGIDLENVLTMVVTSSGPTFAGADDRLLFRSNGPNPAPIGWQASGRNNDTANKSMKVATICAALSTISTVVGSGTVTPGGFDPERQTCPRGTLGIGGGIDLENVLTMVVTSSGPTFAGADDRLIFRPNGTNPTPTGFQASGRNNDMVNKSMKMATICTDIPYRVRLPIVIRRAQVAE